MRADARKNYSHLLAVARKVVTKHGADTGGKAAPESVGNGPLDAKDVDRPDGRRYQQPDTNAGEHQLDAG